jgi:hypothetical protein
MSEFLLGLTIGVVASSAVIWLAKAGWTWLQTQVTEKMK